VKRWIVCLLAAVTFGLQSPAQSHDIVALQITLDRLWYSPGCIDGKLGPLTQRALAAWQSANGVPPTGQFDAATAAVFPASPPLYIEYVVTAQDLAQLGRAPQDWKERSQVPAMAFESVAELVAEKFHTTEGFLAWLNPGLTNDTATLRVPNTAEGNYRPGQAARLHVRLTEKTIRVLDAEGKVIALFPCSIAAAQEKRPVGWLTIVTVAANPNYTFDPVNFPELDAVQRGYGKLIIPPGPNNPVGTVWIGLSRPGYGIHGTPHPEQIGKTESHGCFRLANWNAERLLRLVSIGLPVEVSAEPAPSPAPPSTDATPPSSRGH
jgi:lipoprotein-anchoring transpeptidase ErfK/SrfK